MGWDDNGLNVERRVQLVTGTIVDPTLPYDPDFRPPDEARPEGQADRRSAGPTSSSCARRSSPQFEEEYYDLWSTARPVGRLGPHLHDASARRRPASASGASCASSTRGLAYRSESPTLWDVDMRTVGRPGRARGPRGRPAPTTSSLFAGPDGEPLPIDTTRPELLPACVAVVAHPDDERYQPLFGTAGHDAALRRRRSRSVAHELADPEKGTGLVMVCTFGDTTDVTGGASCSSRPAPIVQRDGRLARRARPTASTPTAYAELAGKTVKQAQTRIVELLARGRRASRASPGRSPTR